MDFESDAAFTNTKVTKNYAKFYPMWKRNRVKSEAEGKEVGEWVDFVVIIAPGQNKDEWHGKASAEIIAEYPDQWNAYKAGKEQRISGMPLELLPGLAKGRADMYKAHYVHTVEQLAELSEPARQKFGLGTLEDMKKAQQFLQHGSGEVLKLREENADLKRSLGELKSQVAVLMQRKKPGPKPKAKPQSVEAA